MEYNTLLFPKVYLTQTKTAYLHWEFNTSWAKYFGQDPVEQVILLSSVGFVTCLKLSRRLCALLDRNAEYSRSSQILICRLNIWTLCILFCCLGLHRFEKVESRGKLIKLGTKTWNWPRFWSKSGHQCVFAGFCRCCSQQRRSAEAILVLEKGAVGKILVLHQYPYYINI